MSTATEMSINDECVIVNKDFLYTLSRIGYITRLLIIGSRKAEYNQKINNTLSPDDIDYIHECITAGEGFNILRLIGEIYESGRAAKQDITLQIHAILCRAENPDVRQAALGLLKQYRTISHIYNWKNFHSMCVNPTLGKVTKGFGRGVKRSLNAWFLAMREKPMDLAYQITKYAARNGWSFEQLLKCSHLNTGTGDDRVKTASVQKHAKPSKPAAPATAFDLVLRFAVMGYDEMKKLAEKYKLTEEKVYTYLSAIHEAKHLTNNDEANTVRLMEIIYEHRLTREQVPTWALKDREVLTALLLNRNKTKVTMPLTALVRNLGSMSAVGVYMDPAVRAVVNAHLLNSEAIIKSRIHPVAVILAWFTYKKGHGLRGSNTWTPQPEILNTLEQMFYLSFKNVEPTGKRICFLIDASGSMTSDSLCEGVTNAEIAALLAMIFSRSESKGASAPQHAFYLFTANNGCESGSDSRSVLYDVSDVIDADAPLATVLTAVQRSDWGMTDISMGILDALKFKRRYDAFVVITDNDVNSGIKPAEAMKQYRQAMNMPKTKLAVVATQSSELSIADPADPFMMDFCGFDSHGPRLLQDFIRS